MLDQPPPSRLSVLEKGGRLVVIDRETGTVPLSAAERMKIWDARFASQTPQSPQKREAVLQTPTENPWAVRRSHDSMAHNPAKLPVTDKPSAPSDKARTNIGYGPIFAVYAAAIGLLILLAGWGALPFAFALGFVSLKQQWPNKIQAFLQEFADKQSQSGTDKSARP